MHSRAASGPWPSPARALASVACTPSGACRAISWASSRGPRDVRPGRHHLLDQPDPQGLGGAELLRGEQEAHRVAPAELRGRAEGGAAERHDPAADLQLAKAHVIGGDHDVGGQGELDRQGERDAVDRHDDRLGHRVAPDAERVEAVRAAQRRGPCSATAGPTSARSRPAEK